MKNKLYVIALILLTPILILSFYYPVKESQSPSGPPAPNTGKFYYGAIQSIWSYPNYDNLGLNLTHSYVDTEWDPVLNRYTPKGWASANDHLTSDITDYDDDLRTAKEIMYQHNQSKFLYQRPKIEWLAFGQSSTYEAEPVLTTDPLWFYSFNVSSGVPQNDNGRNVLFCGQPAQGPGARYVLEKLKAITEQCRRIIGAPPLAANHWTGDSECEWLIKPMMRIPALYPVTNPETPVCKITVYKEDGLTVKKETIIKAKYFLNDSLQYDGSYKEEFNFFGETDLTFTGDLGSAWEYKARGNQTNEQGYNLADIKVFWYDNCEMWIDYVKVENDVADRLLKGNDVQYEQWIETEADIAEENPAVFKFYVEYVEFNNLPCIKYVNDKLRFYTSNQVDLVVDFHDYGLFHHVPVGNVASLSSAEWLHDNFIQRGGFSMIFSQCYPMKSRYYDPPDPYWTTSKIPPTLPKTGCPPNTPCGILSCTTATTEEYDSWLQDNYDHSPFYLESGIYQDRPESSNPCNQYEHPELKGNFRYTLKVCDEISRMGNIPFVFMPQAHQWFTPHEINREPTNEELEVMANLAVTYGARGLMWWWYPSFEDFKPQLPFKELRYDKPPE
ncbi:MAG TPA: hypothetical protein PKE39_16695 [Ignavibacteria bacterium]|nr:hypothetical protein [Ignavibacteria bacterium]HMR00664.1 hypothetical protein [Ignavibacteria bacterium]